MNEIHPTDKKAIYLRAATHDSFSRTSNGSFRVDLDYWPVELNKGCHGVSLINATFPLNQPNITVNNNKLAYVLEPIDDFDLGPPALVLPQGAQLAYRYRDPTSIDATWSDYKVFTVTPVGGYPTGAAVRAFTTLAAGDFRDEFDAALTAHFQAETGDTDGAFAIQPIWYHDQNRSKWIWNITFTSSTYEIEYATVIPDSDTSILFGLGITDATNVEPGIPGITGTQCPLAQCVVVPPGQYNDEELFEYINGDLSTLTPAGSVFAPPVIETDVVADPGPPIVFETTADTDERWYHTTTAPDRRILLLSERYGSTLAPFIGMDYNTDTHEPTIDSRLPHTTNLFGAQSLWIHSSIIAGRTTVDGDGGIISIAKGIPVTAAYRELQTYTNDDDGTPDIYFNRRKEFTQINVTLRDSQGRPYDIGSGELMTYWKLYY